MQHENTLRAIATDWRESIQSRIDIGTAKNIAEAIIRDILAEKLRIAVIPATKGTGMGHKRRGLLYAYPNKRLVLNTAVKNKQVKCPSCERGLLEFRGKVGGKIIASCQTCGINYYAG